MDRKTLVKQALKRLNSQKEHVIWQLGQAKELLESKAVPKIVDRGEVETRIVNLEETLAIINLTHELLTAEQTRLKKG